MILAHAGAPARAHGSSPPMSGAAPPGAPPGAPPFQSALAEQWARTATAEGQRREHSHEEHKPHEHELGDPAPVAAPTVAAAPIGAVPPFGSPGKLEGRPDRADARQAFVATPARAAGATDHAARSAASAVGGDRVAGAPAMLTTADPQASPASTGATGAISGGPRAGDSTAARAPGDEAAAPGQGASSAAPPDLRTAAADSAAAAGLSLSSSATGLALSATSTSSPPAAADLQQAPRTATATAEAASSADATPPQGATSASHAGPDATDTPTLSSGHSSSGGEPTADVSQTATQGAVAHAATQGDKPDAATLAATTRTDTQGGAANTATRDAAASTATHRDTADTATPPATASTDTHGDAANTATREGAADTAMLVAATSTDTHDALTGSGTTGDRPTSPAPEMPGAGRGQTPPAAVSTTGSGAADARPEPGEAGSSNTTPTRAGDTVIAASAQPDVRPGARTIATSTRGASAHPGALDATLTSGSAHAVDSGADTQPLAAPLPATPASAAATASAALGAGVGMQAMIESIRATVELAVRQGMTQARIALQPEELGEIRIHLSQTSDGLLARLTADTPAAAQMLAGARSELHHSLSSLGLSLLRLDIGSFGQSDVGGGQGRFPGRFEESNRRADGRRDERHGGAQTVQGLASAQPPAGPARGELIDVLA